jgi:hypothetical protein
MPTSLSRVRRLAPVAALTGLALVATACGSSHKTVAATKPAPSPTPAPPTSSSPVPPASVSPLSGLPAAQGLPVIGVKIDNVPGAFPQSGLSDADVVFVEEVEGGLTRLLAVFSDRIPALVGPVRSGRTDNIELLRMFGTPALAYSGANNYVLAAIRNSVLKKASFDDDPSAYQRVSDHVAPHNLLADPAALIKASKPSGAKDVGFNFFNGIVFDGTGAQHITVQYPQTRLQFDRDIPSNTYILSQDGQQEPTTDHRQRAANTVVVLHVTSKSDYDPITPYNITTGEGSGMLFRDGRAIPIKWDRPHDTDPLKLTGKGGVTVPLRPGQTWIVIARENVGVSYK